MKMQQTRSMCTAILNWDQVLRKHFTWVDSAGFGVAHLRMLHVDLKAKLTFPHWGQVQSPSPPRAPVRKILYMRSQRKICNSGFEATHSVSSRKPKVTQQGWAKTILHKNNEISFTKKLIVSSSGYSWVASWSRTQLPIALQDNMARCLRTSLTYTQQSLPSVRARFGPPPPRTSVWPQRDKFSNQKKASSLNTKHQKYNSTHLSLTLTSEGREGQSIPYYMTYNLKWLEKWLENPYSIPYRTATSCLKSDIS
jgi:hypothetical protein